MVNRTDTRILFNNEKGYVFEISETEVGKVHYNNSRVQLEIEANKLQFANEINDLLVKFHRIDLDTHETNYLVIERLYPLQFRALSINKRIAIFNAFEEKIKELHNGGFVHNDLSIHKTVLLERQTLKHDIPVCNNIMLTNTSLRLIDAGQSFLRVDIGANKFKQLVDQELSNLMEFKPVFLNGYNEENT